MNWFRQASNNSTVHLSAAAVLTALSVIWIAANIIVLGLDLPFWDQWAFVSMLADYRQGNLELIDLVSQHNEHRPVFPRLIWLALASWTNYNTTAELWANYVLAGLTLAIFFLYARWVWSRRGPTSISVSVFVPLITLLIFNMVQWESWLLGFQTVMYLGIGAVIVGFLVMARYPDWRGFVGAILLGIVATYSMANALLYWPIGFVLVLAIPAFRHKTIKAVVWSGTSVLVAVAFLYDWSSPHVHVDTITAIEPVTYVHWLLNFLGAPILAYPPAFLFGIISILLLTWITVVLRNVLFTREVLPHYAIILFIIGSGAVIGIGRSRGGAEFALAPRYITLTAWYWAAIIALLSLTRARPRLTQSALALIAVVLLLSTLGGAVSGYKWRYLRTLPAYESVRAGAMPEDDALIAIYSEIDPSEMRQRLEFLCAEGLSACRRSSPPSSGQQ